MAFNVAYGIDLASWIIMIPFSEHLLLTAKYVITI
jgi:hypothetical protein